MRRCPVKGCPVGLQGSLESKSHSAKGFGVLVDDLWIANPHFATWVQAEIDWNMSPDLNADFGTPDQASVALEMVFFLRER